MNDFDGVMDGIDRKIERAEEEYKRKIGIIKVNQNYYNCITSDIHKLFGVYRGFSEMSSSMLSMGGSMAMRNSFSGHKTCPECIRLASARF